MLACQLTLAKEERIAMDKNLLGEKRPYNKRVKSEQVGCERGTEMACTSASSRQPSNLWKKLVNTSEDAVYFQEFQSI